MTHDMGTWWQGVDRDEFYRRLHEREDARMRALGSAANATATEMSRGRLTRRQQQRLAKVQDEEM